MTRKWFDNIGAECVGGDVTGSGKREIALLAILLAVAVWLLPAPVAAQLQDETQVDQLLEELAEKNKRRAIYLLTSPRSKIADVSHHAEFTVVERGPEWTVIAFAKPTVPGWVSRDYVQLRQGQAMVTANALNVRQRPAADAQVISRVYEGYQSEILGRSRGFVRITLPAEVTVAIRSDSIVPPSDVTTNSGSWNVKAAKAQTVDKGDGAASEAEVSPERQHLIAPGDAISLLVFGEPDLSVENVRVPQSGRVSFPLIGSVAVVNQTTVQVEQSVAELLSQGYVRNPRLSVTIFSYRPIFIRGAVESTGAFPYTEGLTVAKAIALAGGSKNSAKQQGVNILRDGKTVHDGLSVDSLVEIASGDVITVAEEIGVGADAQAFIYVHGEVIKPGEYIFRRGLTVEKAIVLASGFSLRASKKKITLTRYADVGQNEEPVKLKRVELYTPVKPGDVIDVGASWF